MTGAPLFPIALRLEALPCLVVGGGPVAARKAAALLDCGAAVTVIAPRLSPEMRRLPVRQLVRPYEAGDLAGYRLAVTATGLPEVDRAVFEEGEASGVLVNAADDAEGCRFFLPSLLRRGPVTVAVSTAGTSPYLATWLRRRLEVELGPELEEVADILALARRHLKEAGRSTQAADWGRLLDEDFVALVADGRGNEARARLESWLAEELAPEAGPLSSMTAPAGGGAVPGRARLRRGRGRR